MGQLSATFGLSFIVGPALGALLTKSGNDSVWIPLKLSILLSSITLVLQLFLPESKLSHNEKENVANGHHRQQDNGGSLTIIQNINVELAALRTLSTNKVHRHVFSFFPRSVTQVLAGSIFQNNISNYCISHLGLPTHGTGYIMSYSGVLTVINNLFLLRILKAKFTEEQLLLPSLLLYTFAMFCWGISSNIWHLLCTLTLLSTSGAVFVSTSKSQITKSIPKDSLGEVFGITGSFETLASIIGPSLSTKLIDKYGYLGASRFSCSILLFVAIGIARNKFRRVEVHETSADKKKDN